MRNDFRGVIWGQEAYLKQTDVAFKDRLEPQRCTRLKILMAHLFPETKGAGRFHCPPRSSVWRRIQGRRSVAVGGRAGRQLIMKRSAKGLRVWAFLITPGEGPPPLC